MVAQLMKQLRKFRRDKSLDLEHGKEKKKGNEGFKQENRGGRSKTS